MTVEQVNRLQALVRETERKVAALKEGLDELTATPEAPASPPIAPEPRQRAVVQIGTASVQRGKDAVLEVRLTCPEPIAGFWANLRHSPRLEFLKAECPLPAARFSKSEKGPNHSRHLVSFTTDAATGAASPGTGLVQLEPETVILSVHYKCAITLEPGRYPVDGGRSGIGTPGQSATSWPTLLLNWGSGGIEPVVEGGYVEVTT